jgi:uncharacterized protein (UPF0264 family)
VAHVSLEKPRDSHPWDSSVRLLVSVRDAGEVRAAVHGGADLIDVKDPAAGSLGRPNARTVGEIADALSRAGQQLPLSVALGELTEWQRWPDVTFPARVEWLKLGLAGCREGGWIAPWLSMRRRLEDEAGRGFAWVAVAYADHVAAKAPPPDDVLDAAIETDCGGVLIDTFDKCGGRLRNHLAANRLADWLSRARDYGLQTAVAGSLTIADLDWLLPLRPDIVAVRSAVCVGVDRTKSLDAAAVRRFHRALTGAPAISQS